MNATADVAANFVYDPPAGTLLTTGTHTLSVTVFPTASGYGSATATVTLTVNKGAQVITFPPIRDRTTDESPVYLSATASSGLPIAYSVISGPAKIDGTTLVITDRGLIKVQAAQAGDSNYLPATATQSFTATLGKAAVSSVVNAASYSAMPLASGSYGVAFGAGFASDPATADSVPLPTQLGGTTVKVTDSGGHEALAGLVYVSYSQLNFVLPDGLTPGPGTLEITNSTGKTVSVNFNVAAIAPALFTSDASGKGTAAALFLIVAPDGTLQTVPAVSCSGTPVVCAATPVDVSQPGTKVYVSLYGTGIRGRSGLGGVSLTSGGASLPVTYAGPQPTYPGLDQVNAQLDPSLAGSGQIVLQLNVDGTAANPVTINIK